MKKIIISFFIFITAGTFGCTTIPLNEATEQITSADLSESELKEACDKSDANACFDYAYRLATDRKYVEADLPLDKACKLGHQEACDTQKKYGRDLETQKSFSKLNKKCASGNGKSCLEFSFLMNRYMYTEDAIFLAQKACLKNVQEGCSFYSKLMDEKQNRENSKQQEQAQVRQQQIQQEQLRLQRAAIIQQMRQNENKWVNPLQQLSDSHNAQQLQQPTQQTNCETRSRQEYGRTVYYTDCNSNGN